MRDVHCPIIDHIGQMIGGHLIAFEDDEVALVDAGVNTTMTEVQEGVGATVKAKTHRVRLVAAGARLGGIDTSTAAIISSIASTQRSLTSQDIETLKWTRDAR